MKREIAGYHNTVYIVEINIALLFGFLSGNLFFKMLHKYIKLYYEERLPVLKPEFLFYYAQVYHEMLGRK